MSRWLYLIGILACAQCATSRWLAADPADPHLADKLRLSREEWDEIRSAFRAERGLAGFKVVHWLRSLDSGLVEAHCVDPNSPSPAESGPVFFFRKDDGHWHMLAEVSQWFKEKRLATHKT